MFKLKNKKAFTIIELIVVIAILGILVILGMPKLLGYSAKAQLVRIQHDTKIMQDKMEEVFSDQDVAINEWPLWDNNEKDLGALILKKQLYETEGLVKQLDKSHIKFPKYNWGNVGGRLYGDLIGYQTIDDLNNGQGVLGVGGGSEPQNNITSEVDGYGYKIIPSIYKNEIKTRLDGTFYSNAQGKVYYEPNKPLTGVKGEIAPNCVAADTLDYDFEHETGTIVKYRGSQQYIVIPESFLAEGKCWPVRIIGAGAFQNGVWPRENTPLIKGVIIPPGVEKIEDNAFKDNELEAVIIPPGVTGVGSGAFTGNGNLPSGTGSVIVQGPAGSGGIESNAFNPGTEPVYQIPTDRELGIVIKPSSGGGSGSGGSGGSGGRPTGSISSGSSSPGKVIVIPDIVVVDGVEIEIVEIDKGAFQGQGIIHVTFPSGLERIEDYAFAGNQIIGVELPPRIVHVGNYAFGYNELYDGSKYKWTIGNIDFQSQNYYESVNKKVGNIEDVVGEKIDKLNGKAAMLDHIWLTSQGIPVDLDYNPGAIPAKQDNTNLITSSQLELTITHNSVTVKSLVPDTEVRIGTDGGWQASPHTFTGLNEKVEYTIYARYQETDTHLASQVSNGIQFTTKVYVKPTPGSNEIIGGGDVEAGYLGEVSASQLITGTELSTNIGLTTGTPMADAGWLKFSYKGNIQYVAKKPLRHSISWNEINNAGAVYGTKTVVINGLTYKVRLMKTGPEGSNTAANLITAMHGSEWNRLMLPIHEKAGGTKGTWTYANRVGSNDTANWEIGFTDADLHTHNQYGNGTYSWMQETYGPNTSLRLFRGYNGVSNSSYLTASGTHSGLGWRPVLELVPTP